MSKANDLVYRINDRDEIVYVNSVWDAFARANNADGVIGTAVLHHTLWNYITDKTTRALYHDVLKRIRDGRSVQFGFRCDSPDRRRFMDMQVERSFGGLIEFRTRVLAEEPRAPVAALDPQLKRSSELMRVCGWCSRVDADGEWLEVEDAIVRLRLFERSELPQMSHGICEACYEKMMATLAP